LFVDSCEQRGVRPAALVWHRHPRVVVDAVSPMGHLPQWRVPGTGSVDRSSTLHFTQPAVRQQPDGAVRRPCRVGLRHPVAV